MSHSDLPEVPSLRARADAMRAQNSKFARRLGRIANAESQTGDWLQVLVVPETALLNAAGVPAPTLESAQDLRRDPMTLEDLTDPTD